MKQMETDMQVSRAFWENEIHTELFAQASRMSVGNERDEVLNARLNEAHVEMTEDRARIEGHFNHLKSENSLLELEVQKCENDRLIAEQTLGNYQESWDANERQWQEHHDAMVAQLMEYQTECSTWENLARTRRSPEYNEARMTQEE